MFSLTESTGFHAVTEYIHHNSFTLILFGVPIDEQLPLAKKHSLLKTGITLTQPR